MKRETYKGCDGDCFNCQYSDCIIPAAELTKRLRGEPRRSWYARKEAKKEDKKRG